MVPVTTNQIKSLNSKGSSVPHLAGGEKPPFEDQSNNGASPKSALAKLGHLQG
jgi:hypothetical protein